MIMLGGRGNSDDSGAKQSAPNSDGGSKDEQPPIEEEIKVEDIPF